MPFLDDTGVRHEEHRGPSWGAFATLADQVERLVAVNVGWSVQLVLAFYSATALAFVTGPLFGLVARASQQEYVNRPLAEQMLAELAIPGARTLAPLYGTLGLLFVGTQVAASAGLLLVDVVLRLVLLLLLLLATYWGPLLADQPNRSMGMIAKESARLVLRNPLLTLLTWGVSLLALLLGVISIGGLFLVVPVLMALLQTQLYQEVIGRKKV